MEFLEGLNAPDLGLLINGQDFAATQDMTEDMMQTVTYGGAFGTDGPVLRSVQHADERTISFSAILLKKGVAKGLNSEKLLRTLRDFQIITQRGDGVGHTVYSNCNWTRISISSSLTQVVLTADISVPGFIGKVTTDSDFGA